jgi:tetratricopeptide (TPR) repeat protein
MLKLIRKRERHLYLAGGIFITAFICRLFYLYQIEAIPLFYNLGGDPLTYDLWAQRIAAGDWLGSGVFYQAPLYPYFLAGIELVIGHNLWGIRVVEIVLGSVACSLVYFAGRDFFSVRAGIIAGLCLAFYAPAIFYSVLIDKTAIDAFLVALLLIFLGKASLSHKVSSALPIGLTLGFLALSRENALIWILPIAAWLLIGSDEKRANRIACFAAGLCVVLLPVGLRNLKTGGEFTITTSQAGANFFIGNNAYADGTYGSVRKATGDHQFEEGEATEMAEQVVGHRLSPAEVSHFWFQRSWEYIRSQPLTWTRLLLKKWLLTWNLREIEDSDDFYIYQQWSPLLKTLAYFSNFTVLTAFAAVGCILTRRNWRRVWLLYLMLGSFAFGVALFYVFGRYRYPMIPLLALFAGAAITEAQVLLKQHRFKTLLVGSTALVISAVFTLFPIRISLSPGAEGYNNLGRAYEMKGEHELAIMNAQQALRVDPDYGVAHFNLGNVYANLGQHGKAIREYREAIRILPRFVEPRVYIARDLASMGDIAGAMAEYRETLRIRSTPEAHAGLGSILSSQGKLDEAIDHYRAAVELDGSAVQLRMNLALLLIKRGRLDEAAEEYRQLIRMNPTTVEAHNNLGLILAGQEKIDSAIEEYREALRLKPNFALAHTNLGDALLMKGRSDEAVSHFRKALELDPNLVSARNSLQRALSQNVPSTGAEK